MLAACCPGVRMVGVVLHSLRENYGSAYPEHRLFSIRQDPASPHVDCRHFRIHPDPHPRPLPGSPPCWRSPRLAYSRRPELGRDAEEVTNRAAERTDHNPN